MLDLDDDETLRMLKDPGVLNYKKSPPSKPIDEYTNDEIVMGLNGTRMAIELATNDLKALAERGKMFRDEMVRREDQTFLTVAEIQHKRHLEKLASGEGAESGIHRLEWQKKYQRERWHKLTPDQKQKTYERQRAKRLREKSKI